MLNFDLLYSSLESIGLASWRQSLAELLLARISPGAHGNLTGWQRIIEQLPATERLCTHPHARAIDISGPHLAAMDARNIRRLLMGLAPWRKGPFRIQGIELDSEWRSDLKWDRIKNSISALSERIVLDVGCGNGYYACRMLEAGAKCVIGVDPTLLFVCQFAALQKISGIRLAHVLPLRLHELPVDTAIFDTTLSMGVLYHQRNPHEHLQQLRKTVRRGGEMVLETLVLPGNHIEDLQPRDRYARMRNVWHLPTISALTDWIEDAGFTDLRVVDVSVTTVDEQRTTDWMPLESLAQALDPMNPALTVEGLPAPTRAVIVCGV